MKDSGCLSQVDYRIEQFKNIKTRLKRGELLTIDDLHLMYSFISKPSGKVIECCDDELKHYYLLNQSNIQFIEALKPYENKIINSFSWKYPEYFYKITYQDEKQKHLIYQSANDRLIPIYDDLIVKMITSFRILASDNSNKTYESLLTFKGDLIPVKIEGKMKDFEIKKVTISKNKKLWIYLYHGVPVYGYGHVPDTIVSKDIFIQIYDLFKDDKTDNIEIESMINNFDDAFMGVPQKIKK